MHLAAQAVKDPALLGREIEMAERLLTVTEVAGRLRCDRKTVYRRISAGSLRVVVEGTRMRVRERDLDDYIRGLPRSA